jgi:hypothetical protein
MKRLKVIPSPAFSSNNALTDVKHLNLSKPTDTRRAPVTADDTPVLKIDLCFVVELGRE